MEAITGFLEILKNTMLDLQNSPSTQSHNCGRINGKLHYTQIPSAEKTECHCFMLGSFIRAMSRAKMFPLPTSEALTKSIADTSSALQSIEFEPMADVGKRGRHSDCDLNKRIPRMIKDVPRGLDIPSKYLDHLQSQRQKSGLPSEL